jgi:hypothetical protein
VELMPPKKYWYPNGPRWFRDAAPAFKNKLVAAEISKLPKDQKTALTLQRICGYGMFGAAEKMGMGIDISKFGKLLDAAQRTLELAILEQTPADATEWERKVCRGQTDGGEYGCEFFNPELGKSIQEVKDAEKPLELDGPEEIQVRAFPTGVEKIASFSTLNEPKSLIANNLNASRSAACPAGGTIPPKALSDPSIPLRTFPKFQFAEPAPDIAVFIWEQLRQNFQQWRIFLYSAECAKVRAEKYEASSPLVPSGTNGKDIEPSSRSRQPAAQLADGCQKEPLPPEEKIPPQPAVKTTRQRRQGSYPTLADDYSRLVNGKRQWSIPALQEDEAS